MKYFRNYFWLKYFEEKMEISFKAEKYGVSQTLLEDWEKEQTELKKKIIDSDTEQWQKQRNVTSDSDEEKEENTECSSGQKNATLKYVGGVDISYCKEDEHKACAALVICSLPDLKVVYEDLNEVDITTPYVPGFLAFREICYLKEAVNRLLELHPHYMPQAILVDGNGILHPNGFGAACHLGVLLDIPCIGAAKNLHHVDNLERNEEYKQKVCSLEKTGDYFSLCGSSGEELGVALKTSDASKNPIIVSIGHRCSLSTAIWLVSLCCKYRIPEPLRQADIKSREFLRNLTQDKAKES